MTSEPAAKTRSDGGPPRWLRHSATWVGLAVGAVLVGALAVVLLPAWWADRITGWVLGVPERGLVLGLALGAIFTVVPGAIAVVAMRLRKHRRLIALVVAVIALLPNVLTLAVGFGSSPAHQAMTIGGPNIVGGTIAGIVLPIAAFAVIALVIRSRRHRAAPSTSGSEPDVPSPTDPELSA